MLHSICCPDPNCHMEVAVATEDVGFRVQCPRCYGAFRTTVLRGGYVRAEVEESIEDDTAQMMNSREPKRRACFSPSSAALPTPSHSSTSSLLNSSKGPPVSHSSSSSTSHSNSSSSRAKKLPSKKPQLPVSRAKDDIVLPFDETDLAYLALELKISGGTPAARDRFGSYARLCRLSMSELKHILGFFKRRYMMSLQGMDESKVAMINRLARFVSSSGYQRREIPLRPDFGCPKHRRSSSSSRHHTGSDAHYPSHDRRSSLPLLDLPEEKLNTPIVLFVSCPLCRASHHVRISKRSTHFSCSKCHKLFLVSLPTTYHNADPEIQPERPSSTSSRGGYLELYCMKNDRMERMKQDLVSQHPMSSDESQVVQLFEPLLISAQQCIFSLRSQFEASHQCAPERPNNMLRGMFYIMASSGSDAESQLSRDIGLALSKDHIEGLFRSTAEWKSEHDLVVSSTNILKSNLFQESFLLDARLGCSGLRNMVHAIEPNSYIYDLGCLGSRKQKSRFRFWDLVVHLLQLEKQLLYILHDCARMYLREISRRLVEGLPARQRISSVQLTEVNALLGVEITDMSKLVVRLLEPSYLAPANPDPQRRPSANMESLAHAYLNNS